MELSKGISKAWNKDYHKHERNDFLIQHNYISFITARWRQQQNNMTSTAQYGDANNIF